MTITHLIFEAYLKCQMKCWLRSSGEPPSRNTYAEWLRSQTESYHVAEAKRLLSQTPSGEYATSPCSSRGDGVGTTTEELKAAKWRLALDVFLCADESQVLNGSHRGGG